MKDFLAHAFDPTSNSSDDGFPTIPLKIFHILNIGSFLFGIIYSLQLLGFQFFQLNHFLFLNHIHPKAHKLSPQQKPAPVLEKNVTVPLHANKVAHSITSLSLQTGSLKSYTMHSINVVFVFLIALVSHVLAQNSIQFLNQDENDLIVCFTPAAGLEGIDNVYLTAFSDNVFVYPPYGQSSL